MKNPCLTLLLAVCLLFPARYSLAQGWQWGKRAGSDFNESGIGGGPWEQVIDMATDARGNIYSLCLVYGSGSSLDVGGHALPRRGYDQVLLTSFSCDGAYRWSKLIGTTGTGNRGIALKTDDFDGVYVTGTYTSTTAMTPARPLILDADSTFVPDNRGMFLVKYDTAGRYQWVRTPEPDTLSFITGRRPERYRCQPVDMDTDPEGNVYLLVYSWPAALAGGLYPVPGALPSYHMLRYSRSGDFSSGFPVELHCPAGNAGFQKLRMRLNRSTGKWWMTAYLVKGFTGEDSLFIGGHPVRGTSALARFSSTGAFEWMKENTRPSSVLNSLRIVTRPLPDGFGNVYIAGTAMPGNSFNTWTATNSLSPYHSNCFLMKMDSAGHMLWTSSGNNQFDAGVVNGLALSGNVLGLKGNYVGRMNWSGLEFNWPFGGSYLPFLARFNALTGAIIGIDTLAARVDVGSTAPGQLAADRWGGFYAGGAFLSVNDMPVAADRLESAGGNADIFIARNGPASCTCTSAAVAAFTMASPSGTKVDFTFTGTAAADSVVWYFGDGSSARGTVLSHDYGTEGDYTVCVVVYTACGSSVYCASLNLRLVSVANSRMAAIQVYPNPVHEQLTIRGLPEQVTYTLYDITGRTLQTGSLSAGTAMLALGPLTPGMYLLQLRNEAGELQLLKLQRQ